MSESDKPVIRTKTWGKQEFVECYREFAEMLDKPDMWTAANRDEETFKELCELLQSTRRFVMHVAGPTKKSPMPKTFPFSGDL